jgi:hypothetical protein
MVCRALEPRRFQRDVMSCRARKRCEFPCIHNLFPCYAAKDSLFFSVVGLRFLGKVISGCRDRTAITSVEAECENPETKSTGREGANTWVFGAAPGNLRRATRTTDPLGWVCEIYAEKSRSFNPCLVRVTASNHGSSVAIGRTKWKVRTVGTCLVNGARKGRPR